MRRTLAVIAPLVLLLAACGKTHDSQEGPPTAPADAPAEVPPASAPGADIPADFAGDFNLAGTEPFWATEVRAGRITLTRPDQPPKAVPNPGPRVIAGQAIWDATEGERLTVVLEKKPCNNGMSERVFEYTASVKLGDEVLKGCAARPDAPGAKGQP